MSRPMTTMTVAPVSVRRNARRQACAIQESSVNTPRLIANSGNTS